MKQVLALFLIILLLPGCMDSGEPVQDLFTGRYSGPMPEAKTTCSMAEFEGFGHSNILERTYKNMPFWSGMPIVEASYHDGIYMCKYSISKNYVKIGQVNTYYHHVIYDVGVKVKMDMVPNTADLSTPKANNVMYAKYSIYYPLQKISDFITKTISNKKLAAQNREEKESERNIAKEVLRAQNGDPCIKWALKNNVVVCTRHINGL